jgi:Bifunctional DNA primase/polymerase, N-terminal
MNLQLGTPLDAALDYARRDIGTLPVARGGKMPAIKSPHPEGSEERKNCKGECGLPGHGVYDATTDEVKLCGWFGPGAPYERHNMGAAIPPGVVVLDFDTQHVLELRQPTRRRRAGRRHRPQRDERPRRAMLRPPMDVPKEDWGGRAVGARHDGSGFESRTRSPNPDHSASSPAGVGILGSVGGVWVGATSVPCESLPSCCVCDSSSDMGATCRMWILCGGRLAFSQLVILCCFTCWMLAVSVLGCGATRCRWAFGHVSRARLISTKGGRVGSWRRAARSMTSVRQARRSRRSVRT